MDAGQVAVQGHAGAGVAGLTDQMAAMTVGQENTAPAGKTDSAADVKSMAMKATTACAAWVARVGKPTNEAELRGEMVNLPASPSGKLVVSAPKVAASVAALPKLNPASPAKAPVVNAVMVLAKQVRDSLMTDSKILEKMKVSDATKFALVATALSFIATTDDRKAFIAGFVKA